MGICFPGVAATPVIKSLVMNVLITTDHWHDGMWSMGSRSKWIGIKTIGIWLSLSTTSEKKIKAI